MKPEQPRFAPLIPMLALLAAVGTVFAAREEGWNPDTKFLPLPPPEAIRTIEIPTGYRMGCMASEPMVEEPASFTFGKHGALYVCNWRTYMQDEFAAKHLAETPAQLVAHLATPNGCWRDTAQMLLVSRRGLRRRKAHRATKTNQRLTQIKNMNSIRSFILGLRLVCANAFADEPPALPTKHTARNIEGWAVRVDDRLLAGDNAAIGERALKLLMARLVAITIVVPEPALAKLRAVNIELDLDYGDLHAMQYHPDAGWLKEHGYSAALAKCVHIPRADDFLSPYENHRMPWVVLHELAHGYHDQVLGFENPRIEAVWKKFCDSGKYKSVLTSPGHMREHYGLTDAKEFFAEMTESYFGSNDFYPFVTGELKQAEPETFTLMSDLWGKLPEPAQRKAESKP